MNKATKETFNGRGVIYSTTLALLFSLSISFSLTVFYSGVLL